MGKLELIMTIVKNFGVQMRSFDEPLSLLEEFDNGLRSRLFQSYDNGQLEEFLCAIKPGILYFTEDIFRCHHCFIRINGTEDENEGTGKSDSFAIIGPWIEIMPADEEITSILILNKIPLYLKPEVELYYETLPLISFFHSWEALLTILAEYLYGGGEKFQLEYRRYESRIPSSDYSPKQDDSLSLKLIEKLYQDEAAFLDALQAGDTRQALLCIAKLSRHSPPRRAREAIRNSKTYLLSLNTLARKAVQNSSVHPFHIHTMSNDFARQIEAAEHSSDLNSISITMIRCYCSLVQEYSLMKYSSVVRNVINAVEFSLKRPLSLRVLAKQFNIDPSNLSHHFTREMGMTLTEFVNTKRLEKACHLLAKSPMYIQEIAEDCGYQDVNYFIRLFKRKYGKTPSEYRKLSSP